MIIIAAEESANRVLTFQEEFSRWAQNSAALQSSNICGNVSEFTLISDLSHLFIVLPTGSRIAEQVRRRVGEGRERGVCFSPSVKYAKCEIRIAGCKV